MIIVKDYPPNIDRIKEKFPLHRGVVFTYGGILYNPDDGIIDDPLDIHERTHKLQQGGDPAGWWEKYLSDDFFRFDQELVAYANQYRRFCELNVDKNKRAKFLYRIASDLASDLYGKLCTQQEAMKKIKKMVK